MIPTNLNFQLILTFRLFLLWLFLWLSVMLFARLMFSVAPWKTGSANREYSYNCCISKILGYNTLLLFSSFATHVVKCFFTAALISCLLPWSCEKRSWVRFYAVLEPSPFSSEWFERKAFLVCPQRNMLCQLWIFSYYCQFCLVEIYAPCFWTPLFDSVAFPSPKPSHCVFPR